MENIEAWNRDIAQVTVRGITHICEITKNHELYDVVIDKDGAKNRIESLRMVKPNLKRFAGIQYPASGVVYSNKYLSNFGIGEDDTIAPQFYCDFTYITAYVFSGFEDYDSIYTYITEVTLDEDIEDSR